MYSLNRAQILGNVTKDPEVTVTKSGAKVAQFSVATNRKWKDKGGQAQEDVEFHNVVLWSGLAETAERYVTKGVKVYVDGRLQTRTWDDKDGRKCYKTEIVAENMILLTPKADGKDAPAPSPAPAKTRTANADAGIAIEDIPF